MLWVSFLAAWQRDLCLSNIKIGHSKSLSFHYPSNSFLLYFMKYQSIIYWQFQKLVLHYRRFEKHCFRPQGLNTFQYCCLSLPWPPPAHLLPKFLLFDFSCRGLLLGENPRRLLMTCGFPWLVSVMVGMELLLGDPTAHVLPCYGQSTWDHSTQTVHLSASLWRI